MSTDYSHAQQVLNAHLKETKSFVRQIRKKVLQKLVGALQRYSGVTGRVAIKLFGVAGPLKATL